MINVLLMLDVELLFLFFNNCHIFDAFNKHVNISKINIFSSMFNGWCDNNRFVIIMKIEKLYIGRISSIIMMRSLRCRGCRRSRCKINSSDRTDENLKSISLLLSELSVLIIIVIVEHDKQ